MGVVSTRDLTQFLWCRAFHVLFIFTCWPIADWRCCPSKRRQMSHVQRYVHHGSGAGLSVLGADQSTSQGTLDQRHIRSHATPCQLLQSVKFAHQGLSGGRAGRRFEQHRHVDRGAVQANLVVGGNEEYGARRHPHSLLHVLLGSEDAGESPV